MLGLLSVGKKKSKGNSVLSYLGEDIPSQPLVIEDASPSRRGRGRGRGGRGRGRGRSNGDFVGREADIKTNPPEKLIIRFTTDFNIDTADAIIKSALEKEIANVGKLEEEYTKSMQLASSPYLNTIDSRIAELKAEKLRAEIIELKSRKKYDAYVEESTPYLERYKTMPRVERVIDISGYDEDYITEEENKRALLIETYVKISKKYYNIECQRVLKDTSNQCVGCREILYDTYVMNESCLSCPNCGLVRTSGMISKVIENNSDAITQKIYMDTENFRKAFYRYMGLQDITFDISKMCMELDDELQKNGNIPAAEIKSMPHNIHGKKDGTLLQLLFDTMKSCGYNNYEDGNRIAYELWGWELPTHLLPLEDIIMNDYMITQKIYEDIPEHERNRKSCLGTQFRLYKHLQLRGHSCEPGDFKLPVQSASLEDQENLWMRMVKGASKIDSSIFYIPT